MQDKRSKSKRILDFISGLLANIIIVAFLIFISSILLFFITNEPIDLGTLPDLLYTGIITSILYITYNLTFKNDNNKNTV